MSGVEVACLGEAIKVCMGGVCLVYGVIPLGIMAVICYVRRTRG